MCNVKREENWFRWVPALTSHKSIVVDGDYVYLVGGTSFSVDSSHKFISVLYLGNGDIPAWDLPETGTITPSPTLLLLEFLVK